MKEELIVYIGICVLAVILKFIINKSNAFFGKKKDNIPHAHSHDHEHEEEHFISHLIKYLIIILLAILIYKVLSSYNQAIV